MSFINSVKALRAELKSHGHKSTILATMGSTTLIGIDGTTIDVAANKEDDGQFTCKVGHNDKFTDHHPDDVVSIVDSIIS